MLRNFADKVEWTGLPDDCWGWTGATDRKGYPHLQFRGRVWQAHRVAFTLFVGEIPFGHQVHHACGNKSCVNPRHLEALTTAEHGRLHPKALQTHCVNGHAFDDANTIPRANGTRRGCRACGRKAAREYRERQRAAVA